MSLLRPVAVAATLALAASLAALSPAHAAPQALFGTTVDVIAQPSGDAVLGSTAYVPVSGGTVVATLAASLGSDVDVTLLNGATTIDTCTIVSGDTTCGLSTGGILPAGPTAVTVRFVMGVTTVDYTGTLFAVTSPAPTVRIQWQDAAGTWVDGSGIGLPLRGPTALRCVVTNNSNAPITFVSFTSSIALSSSGSIVVPLTGSLAAGVIGYYPIWSGLASEASSASCAGGVSLRDGTGTGNGTSGGVIPIGGTITVDRTPAPGTTVTITGDLLVPPVVSQYAVLLDGVAVAGSPVAVSGPDFDFSLAVAIPASLAPGTHVLSIVASYSGQNSALAAFTFSVAEPQLAATGAALDESTMATPSALAILVVLAGLVLVLTARQRRGRERINR